MKLHKKTTIKELMKHYPEVLAVFIRRKLGCVGCPAEAFHTLEDVAYVNDLDLDRFLDELRRAISLQRRSLNSHI
jgi:hybrid cluster-associated redox disulfide protein